MPLPESLDDNNVDAAIFRTAGTALPATLAVSSWLSTFRLVSATLLRWSATRCPRSVPQGGGSSHLRVYDSNVLIFVNYICQRMYIVKIHAT